MTAGIDPVVDWYSRRNRPGHGNCHGLFILCFDPVSDQGEAEAFHRIVITARFIAAIGIELRSQRRILVDRRGLERWLAFLSAIEDAVGAVTIRMTLDNGTDEITMRNAANVR